MLVTIAEVPYLGVLMLQTLQLMPGCRMSGLESMLCHGGVIREAIVLLELHTLEVFALTSEQI